MNNNNVLTNEQWLELSNAINLFDQTHDRTVLNRILISIMKNFIESLDNDDDDFQENDDDNMEKQFVIALIESELAEMNAVHGRHIFGTQMSNEKMMELLHFVETNTDGNVNYKGYFATLMLIVQ
ncbi:unnamed protein product [Rotaria sp. Silwood2]|nr:unnamed protein product [Rotaria sp. Silwood2]CAF4603648.1 unnamed protein product [Rotaria sp. Silwood2]